MRRRTPAARAPAGGGEGPGGGGEGPRGEGGGVSGGIQEETDPIRRPVPDTAIIPEDL